LVIYLMSNHLKLKASRVKCLAQGHNKRTCQLVLHNAECQVCCEYQLFKSFGLTWRGNRTQGLPTARRTL